MHSMLNITQLFKISGFADEISPNFNEQLKGLLGLGMRYIEIRGVDGKNISKLSYDEIIKVQRKLERAKIFVSAIGSPIGKIGIDEDFAPHFELFCKMVDFAKILSARYIRVFSFYTKGDPFYCRDEVLLRLKKMISYAKTRGIILLHENEKGIYGDDAERCYDLMRELGCDHFKATFDFANFVQTGCDTLEAYTMLKPYIAYLHIKDAIAKTGEIVPAGHGDGQILKILTELYISGYKGFLSLEPHLKDFKGLKELESGFRLDGGESDRVYGADTKGGAFTVAFEALRDILERETEVRS